MGKVRAAEGSEERSSGFGDRLLCAAIMTSAVSQPF